MNGSAEAATARVALRDLLFSLLQKKRVDLRTIAQRNGGEFPSMIAARGVAANIEYYVESIQNKNK
jgi:hypothetical protein